MGHHIVHKNEQLVKGKGGKQAVVHFCYYCEICVKIPPREPTRNISQDALLRIIFELGTSRLQVRLGRVGLYMINCHNKYVDRQQVSYKVTRISR